MNKKKLAPGILAIQFLVLLSYSSIAILTLLSLYFEHLGGSPRQIGFLLGLFSLAAFLSRPFGGWLLSRYNPKKVMISGLILLLIMTASYLFIKELNWFVVMVRIFHGLGFSIFILAALLTTVSLVSEEARAYAIGVVSTGFMIPLLVIPFLGEEIINSYGFFFFFLSALILAAIPLIFAFFIRINHPGIPEESQVEAASFFRLLKRKRIYLIFLLTLIFEMGLSSILAFIPLLAHRESAMRSGIFYTFLGFTAVFMRIVAGSRLRFWGSPKLILPAFCFLSGGGVLTYFSSTNLLLGLSGVIWGIGVGILYPHLSSLVIEKVPYQERGKVLSLFSSSVDLGFALGPLLFGWIFQFIGLRPTFILYALFVFLSSSVLVFWGRSTLLERRNGQS